ncbi:hypothetical protein PCASD_04033 [Puccinia coronata f. sp. avenae]|uniref:Arrestin-like N-terminal domain-containing protein n=1 Tax=Puccinia coronata f. sp. avenae TaxID=200324 RepID=A0A2N5V5I3_9BASI|nr:hypothetical protein PCASD_04033 [Puccinia coronata f. sp. avenae]
MTISMISISIHNPLVFLHPQPISPTQLNRNHSALSNNTLSSHVSNPTTQPQLISGQQQQHADTNLLLPSIDHINSGGTLLSGSLMLNFSKPKEIRKIIISLCGQSYIGFDDRPYEYQTILSKELEIDLELQLLNNPEQQHPNPGSVYYNSQHKTYIMDKGHYCFNWSFILPPDLSPYERCEFGRTTHKVIAKVKLGSGPGLGFRSIGKNLTSILFGGGGAGHEMKTKSYFVAISDPSGNNDDLTKDLGLNINLTDQSEQLGPYTLSASSCYFTVAGLLSVKFKLEKIPQRNKKIKIYKIACLIKQQYRLTSIKDKNSKTGRPAESRPPPKKIKVFVLDHSNVPKIRQFYPHAHPFNHTESENCSSDYEYSNSNQDQTSSNLVPISHSHLPMPHSQENAHLQLAQAEQTLLHSSLCTEPLEQPPSANNHSSSANDPATIMSQSHPQNNTTSQATTSSGYQRTHSSHHSIPARPFENFSSNNSPEPQSDQDIPLVTLTDDHASWEIEHIGRLPTDDVIRPSTNSGTQTNIQIFHTLIFEIHFSVENDWNIGQAEDPGALSNSKNFKSNKSLPPKPILQKVLSIKKSVQISSCCCMVENLVLPPYSTFDPNAEFVQDPTPSHAARRFKCVCGISTDVLLKTQNPKNIQSVPNSDQQQLDLPTVSSISSSDSSSVTTSSLTFHPTKSTASFSPNLISSESLLDHPSSRIQNCNLNHFDNAFIHVK